MYPAAAVAHERAESTQAGITMLHDGGNAVDAAVAVGFAACVLMPAWTTIAGSGFMLIDPGMGQRPVAVEFPPRAPLGASTDMYGLEHDNRRTSIIGVSTVVDDANVRGARAVGVPGVVAGLCEANARFGRLPLAKVMAPAIELAREGFPIDAELQIKTLEVLRDLRDTDPAVWGTLLGDDGLPLTKDAGAESTSLVVQPQLADTLEAVARGGPDAFYRGPAGRAIVAEAQRGGGVLSAEDLHRAGALVTTPLSLRVGDATVVAPTSPGGGWTELQILGVLARLGGMLEGDHPFDLKAYVETSRRCFADRFHFMGDPDHVDVPLDVLLSDDYLDALATEVARTLRDPVNGRMGYATSAPWSYYARHVPEAFARHRPDRCPTAWQAGPACARTSVGDSFETTHLSAIDHEGMAVSCTLTAGHTYGSRIVAAGVVLDDAMIWFNATPGTANSITPWKRPLVNMGPLLVRRDDGRRLAIGAPGGRRIMSAVSQVTAHWLRGESLEQATAEPRIDGSGPDILAPARLGLEQLEELRGAGYVVRIVEDRDPFCVDFARPVAVGSTSTGAREAAVQPYVQGAVGGY
jgi:gamma-glutamyltranspeptidase/glutathione hydrolase